MAPLSQEEENYVRLSLLLTGITPRAVRLLFDKEFHPSVLQSTIQQQHSKLVELNNNRIINQAQFTVLSTKPDSKHFDITLMICLLTNFTTIRRYVRLPYQHDTSNGADLARIKHYRNFIAHLDDSRVNNSYFVTAWNDISGVLGRLGGSDIIQECVDLRTKVLDRSNLEIIRKIKSSQNEINILKQTVQDTVEELEDVKEKLDAFEIMSKNVIPLSLRGVTKKQLESWIKADHTFVTTYAVEHILACMQIYSFVIVTGSFGVGKTSAMRHVALQLQKQGFIIVPTSKPEDIVNVYNKVPKTVFVIDDLCGRYTLNQQYLDGLKPFLDLIKILLKECKIIATCRLQVSKDERFKNLSVLNYTECSMNSKELYLTDEERSNLTNAYFKENKDEFIESYKKFDCFPLLCKVLSAGAFETLFKNPFDCFKNEFDEYLIGGQISGQYKYCALCLIAMFGNKLKKRYLKNEESTQQTIVEHVLIKCRLPKGTSFQNILDALHTLDGSLVVKKKGVYRIIHDKIFDYVAYYFGNKMLDTFINNSEKEFIRERFVLGISQNSEEYVEFTIRLPDNMLGFYIKRMVYDWKQGHVAYVFSNRNMRNRDFLKEFFNYLITLDKTEQFSLAGTIDYIFGNTPLLLSCIFGNVILFHWILDCLIRGTKTGNNILAIHKRRRNGASPILCACDTGVLEIVNRLIQCKADINICDNNGVSPVYNACQNGHVEILNRLLECNADVNKGDNRGASPVYIACEKGYLQILNNLIKCKAEINKCTNNGASPVYVACQNGFLKTLNRLIAVQADINKCCKDGTSPVYIACHNGHLSIVNRLIECKANIDQSKGKDPSPLHLACEKGHLDILNVLINCKADINKGNSNGASPAYLACQEGHLNILNRLIECQADINKSTNIGASPVFIACQNGYLDVLNKLIECKADLNKCTSIGTSPIYIACQNGRLDIIKRLMACNVHLAKYINTHVSLYSACQNGYFQF